MAKKVFNDTYVKAIADSIRTKLGTTDTFKISEMSSKVDSIPTGITPTGELSITANGDYDVAEYASANVNVPTGSPEMFTVSINNSGEPTTNYYGIFTYHIGNIPKELIDQLSSTIHQRTGNQLYYSGYFLFGGLIGYNEILDLSDFDFSGFVYCQNMFRYFAYKTSATGIIKLPSEKFGSSIKDSSYMFYNCGGEIKNLENFNTSNVNNMSYMFGSYRKPLDLSGFNTSNVTNMSYMFTYFSGSSLEGLENFDTSNVTNMSYMFSGYSNSSLTGLNFNIQKIKYLDGMFSYCSKLTKLDLSSFDTSNVTSMSYMFRFTYKISVLDISNFVFTNVTSYSSIFAGCGTQSLKTDGAYADGIPYVYVKDETTQNWILSLSSSYKPSSWTTANVIIAGSDEDTRTS